MAVAEVGGGFFGGAFGGGAGLIAEAVVEL